MISVEQGKKVMIPRIESRSMHEHYDRTVDRRKLYNAMMTGENLSDYLLRFERTEDKEMFDMRKKVTNQAVTPSVNEAASKFYKTSRYPNIKKDLYYETNVSRINTLQQALAKFTYEGDIQSYIAMEYDMRSLIDPNAFLVMDFLAYDALANQRPECYGVFIPCDDVVDFEFLPNDELNFLIIKRPYQFYNEDGDLIKLTDYYGYLGNEILVFEQYEDGRYGSIGPRKESEYVDIGHTDYYAYVLQSQAGQVQAFRLGYIKDPITHYKTVVSPLDKAEPVVRDLNNDKSEYDQTKRAHVFPQKLQFVEPCPGESTVITCRGGLNIDGKTCKVCHGTGNAPIHTSSSDIITYRVPRQKDDYFLPLAEMIHYAKPDIEIIQHLRDDVEAGKLKVIKAIFTTETAVKTDGTTRIENTATEFVLKNDDLNNILLPFCQHKVKFYKFVIRQVALFNDIEEGLVIIFEFPESLRLESVEELQVKFGVMVSQGTPAALLDDIENEIAAKRFIDDADALNRYEIWNTHRPFRNRTESEIQFAIGNGSVPKHLEVLWANFEYIKGIIDEDESFYKKKFVERAAIIKAEVDKLVADLEPEPMEGFLGGQQKQQVAT